MRRTTLFIFLLSLSLSTYSQKQNFTPKESNESCYTWLTFLTEGEIKWVDLENDSYYGESYRLLITTSEIYNQLYIEKINYGMEGCCKKIVEKKEIPIDKIFETFHISGETAGVKFVHWINSTSFKISIYKKEYLIENIDRNEIQISSL